MSAFQQFRHSLNDLWDSLMEGWQHLSQRAASAMTRFRNPDENGELITREQKNNQFRNVGWGLLAAEMLEDPDKLVLRLEVPGMEREDFDIQVVQDRLVVRGTKKYQAEHGDGSYHIMECAYGQFERVIPLPLGVEVGAASARYKRGVLTVELPRIESQKRRSISVSQEKD